MDNRTIRQAFLKRIPEVYFIGKPVENKGKIYWIMYAKIDGQKRPVEIIADMPKTSLVSHRELLTNMVNEVADEIKKIRTGRKSVQDRPDENYPPLSLEGQKVFDSPDIQYISMGEPNVNPKPKLIMP